MIQRSGRRICLSLKRSLLPKKNLRNPLSLWRSLFRPILGPIPILILSLSNQSLPLSRHLFLKSRLPNRSGRGKLWVGGVM